MRRLLIKIGYKPSFMSNSDTDFEIVMNTDILTEKVVENILSSLKEALHQEIKLNE